MRKYISILIAFIWIPQAGHSQVGKSHIIYDSLQVDRLQEIELITEIYDIPHTRYNLDHFVFVRRTYGIDPYMEYNKGERISGESRLFLQRFIPGDTLIIKEVYALNSESPEKGLVKLPEKMFLLK